MKLVVRISPKKTESLMGYLLRLTEANGYPTMAYIRDAMTGELYRNSVGRLDASPLSELADQSAQAIELLTMRPDDKPKAFVRLLGNDIPSYELRMVECKVCPKCIAAGSPCEAFWELSQAAACPVHGVRLVNRCNACECKIIWTRSKVAQCRCGAGLGNIPTETVSDEFCNLMAILRHKVYSHDCEVVGPSAMSHLEHLDLRQLCKLLWVMSTMLHLRAGGKSLPKTRSHYINQLELVAKGLSNWPFGFRTLLDEQYRHEAENAKKLPRFKSLFNWLFTRLVKNDPAGGGCYSFLEREVYRFGASFWTKGMMRRSNGTDFSGLSFRWGTSGEAAAILGLHLSTMKKETDSGKIKMRRISDGKSRNFLVDLDWAREQKRSGSSSISRRDAAKALGISNEAVRAARTSGLLVEKHRPRFPRSLAVEDVKILLGRFQELTIGKKTQRRNAISISSLFLDFGGDGSSRVQFYVHLLANPGLVAGPASQPFKIDEMLVRADLAREAMRDIRKSSESVTAQAALARLKVAACVVTALRKQGLIETKMFRGREVLCADSLKRFEERYEVLASVFSRLDLPMRRIVARVDFSKIPHIRVRNAGGNTIFIERNSMKDAERLVKCAAVM